MGLFDRLRSKPLSQERITQIQELMEKNPSAARDFFRIFDIKELKSMESFLDKNSKSGKEWVDFRDAAKDVLKSKEGSKKLEDEIGRIANFYGVEPRDFQIKQIVEEEKRKKEKGEFGKEKLDESAMESSARMFEKAEEAEKEKALRQYPQTADFFRVVEKEDENKLFSPNRSLLPQISEAEIKKVSDIGMRETTTSSFLSKVMHVLRGATPREEERKEKEGALQQLADKLTVLLVDFWGIPNIKPFSVRVQIFDIGKDKKTRESLPWAGAVDKNGIHFILVNQDYLNEEFRSGIMNIKSVLAEEVCHYLENDIKSMYGQSSEDRYVSEFFGIISRFCIAEQIPELFHEDYRRYLHQAANFSIEKKEREEKLKKLAEDKRKIQSDMIEGKPNSLEELKRIEEEEKEVKDDLEHLSYYPGAAYYYEVKAMSRQQRFQLLMESPQQIRDNIIEGKLVGILDKIGPKVYDRESRKFTDAMMTKFGLEQTPETGKFFQRIAEEHGKEEYGRETEPLEEPKKFVPFGSLLKDKSGTFPRRKKEEIQEKGTTKNSFTTINNFFKSLESRLLGHSKEETHQKELREERLYELISIFNINKETKTKEETTKEEALQELAYKLSFQLADFWNIPRPKILVPTVAIADEKEMKKAGIHAESAVQLLLDDSDIKFLERNLNRKIIKPIIVKEEYLREEFESGIINIKSVMAEEVCHSMEQTFKEQNGITKDYYVAEFFGLISRLFISQQVPELFPESYREILHQARGFTKEKTQLNGLIDELDGAKLNLSKSKSKKSGDLMAKYLDALIKNTEIKINDLYSHLAYYPAAAYYFEVKNMTPQERSELLKMEPEIIKKKIIEGKAEKLLQDISKTIQERKVLKQKREKSMKAYPESSSFFGSVGETAAIERAASEIGKAAYGRIAEAVTAKLEQHEQESPIETGEVMEEYPQEEQEPEQFEQEPSESEEYPEEEPTEAEYQETEEEEQTQGEQPEEAQEEQYGPESEQAPQQPKINISIPEKVTKKVAKKLESMGVKLPKKMIKS